MAASPNHHHTERPGAVGTAVGLAWYLLTWMLVLSAALLVLGGSRIVESTWVRLVLVGMLAVFAVHTWLQSRRREPPSPDERRHRERRGF